MENAQAAQPGLKAVRLDRGWTKADLARASGVSDSTVGNAEAEPPKYKTRRDNALKMATALGVTVEQILHISRISDGYGSRSSGSGAGVNGTSSPAKIVTSAKFSDRCACGYELPPDKSQDCWYCGEPQPKPAAGTGTADTSA